MAQGFRRTDTWRRNVEAELLQNGKIACMAGKKLTDNPHKPGSSHHDAWEAGFLLQQNKTQ